MKVLAILAIAALLTGCSGAFPGINRQKAMPSIEGLEVVGEWGGVCSGNLAAVMLTVLDEKEKPGYQVLYVGRMEEGQWVFGEHPIAVIDFNPDTNFQAVYVDKNEDGHVDETYTDEEKFFEKYGDGACDVTLLITGGR